MVRTSRHCGLVVPLLATLLAIGGGDSTASAADRWTNLTGTSTVSGEMIGLWNGRVLLQLEGGRRVSVRMEDLRAESRIQAEKRLVEIQERLQQRRSEIAQAAQEAEAPAPTQKAELIPAPSYSAPPVGADLRTTLVGLRDQLAAGHLRVLYDTLPASHQQQADQAWALTLTKLNSESFESVRNSVHGVAELIVTRQRWLLSHPRLAQLSDDQQQGLVAGAEFILALTGDDVLSLANLRSRSLGESIALLDEALAPHLYRLISGSSLETSGVPVDFEVEAGNGGVMTAHAVVPLMGPMGSMKFKSVEGRWVVSEERKASRVASSGSSLGESSIDEGPAATTAPGDDDSWKQAHTWLESQADESLRLPPAAEVVLQQVNAAIAPLQQAQSQHEFHRALDELLPQIAVVVNQVAGFKPPVPGAPRGYGEPNYYGNESETLDDPTLSSSADSVP